MSVLPEMCPGAKGTENGPHLSGGGRLSPGRMVSGPVPWRGLRGCSVGTVHGVEARLQELGERGGYRGL